jgi:Flp pilus assembly protein TadD
VTGVAPRSVFGLVLLCLLSFPQTATAERPLPDWAAWESDRVVALGEVALARQDLALARSHAERATSLNPANKGAWSLKTRTNIRIGAWADARSASRQSLALDPTEREALLLAAKLELLAGNTAAALLHYKRLGEQGNDDLDVALGLALCAAYEQQWGTMEEQLREALRLNPRLALASLPLQSSWAFIADRPAGIAALERVLEADAAESPQEKTPGP